MKIKIQSGEGVLVNAEGYPAVFDRLEWASIKDKQTGVESRRLKMIFIIAGGEHHGQAVDKLLTESWGPKSFLPRYLAMIAGKKLDPGEEIDTEKYQGRQARSIWNWRKVAIHSFAFLFLSNKPPIPTSGASPMALTLVFPVVDFLFCHLVWRLLVS